MPQRVGLLVNPTAGAGRGARAGAALRAALESQGASVVDLSGTDFEHASAQARQAAADASVDVLAVCGGDGMAGLGVDAVAQTGMPLAILPAGTGNDLARALGLARGDVVGTARRILAGEPTAIDAIRTDGAHGTRWFGGVLGAGFDSAVNERANRWAWGSGTAKYTAAVLRELPVFTPAHYRVSIDGVDHSRTAMLVSVGNNRCYGGGMQVLPDAKLDDGLLDVLLVDELTIAQFLRVFPRVFKGTHVTHPAVRVVRGRVVEIDAPGRVGYADGERFGPLPMRLEVVPSAVKVMLDAGTVDRLA